MARYRFEPTRGIAGRYRDTATGRFVPASVVRRELDRYLDNSDTAARQLAGMLRNHQIGLSDWELQMRRMIKNTHINSIALERGGYANMRPSDFGRAGNIIRRQYEYLRNFALQIADGVQPLDGRLDFRAQLYANAGRNSYYQSMHENLKPEITHVSSQRNVRDSCRGCLELDGRWFRIGDPAYRLPGNRDCLHNCRCTERFASMGAAGQLAGFSEA